MHFESEPLPETRKSRNPAENQNERNIIQAMLMMRSPEGELAWSNRYRRVFREMFNTDGFFELVRDAHMETEAARKSALLTRIQEMLDAELRSVAQIRKDGYTPSEAAGSEVKVRRGEPTAREQRLRFPYEITVQLPDGESSIRDADIELTQIQGAWKVVRVRLTPRAR